MPNLRDRLRRIQSINREGTPKPEPVKTPAGSVPRPQQRQLRDDGWEEAGYQTLKKVFILAQHIPIPPVFPAALPIVIPDTINRSLGESAPAMPAPTAEDLLFFDLETTGLSGGAGTVAFLAAFGRLIPCPENKKGRQQLKHELQISQYLLLDYPGESDFLDAVLKEFSCNQGCRRAAPLVVSYNGKAFDSQILKTRCLMNAIHAPQYLHADLLHPARRLWKRLLENCSQATIEGQVLDIDRTGDVSGALAPEIWFDFLRTGKTSALMDICEHNRRDIRGLASIFALMACVAEDPINMQKKYAYDVESLALRWHDCLRYGTINGEEFPPGESRCSLLKTGQLLLNCAAEKGGGRAALVLALQLLRTGSPEKGRHILSALVSRAYPVSIQVSALRYLAIDSERYCRDYASALKHVNAALDLDLTESQRNDFEHRKNRLLEKLKL